MRVQAAEKDRGVSNGDPVEWPGCSYIANRMSYEDQKEWDYRYQERLGMLCGADVPTVEEEAMARHEADEAIKKLNGQLFNL